MLERALPGSVAATGVAIDRLEAGTVIIVNTQNSRYRLVVLLEPHVVLVRGGSMFPEATVVRFAGATADGKEVKGGWILVGSHMEMWLDSARITSSLVRSVSIDAVPAVGPRHRDACAGPGRCGSH